MTEENHGGSGAPNGDNHSPGGWGLLTVYAGLGIEIPAAILIGVLVGAWIGARWNHRDIGALIGLGFGIGAAVRSTMKVWKIWKKQNQ